MTQSLHPFLFLLLANPLFASAPFGQNPDDWCATSQAHTAELALVEAEAALRTLPEGPGVQFSQQNGFLILNDTVGETLNNNNPFDLGGQSLRFNRISNLSFQATRIPLAFNPNLGPLVQTFTESWGQQLITVPFSFPFGDQSYSTFYVTSDLGLFFQSQPPSQESGRQFNEFDTGDTTPRIAPLMRNGPWIWTETVDLYVRFELGAIQITWQPRTTRPTAIQGVDQRVQMRLTNAGQITMSFPDASSRNTFGLVQVVAPVPDGPIGPDSTAPAPPPAVFDFSTLSQTPMTINNRIGEAFTFPTLLPTTARDLIRDHYGAATDDIDLYAFYQNFYTAITFVAGAYHAGNVLHMNEINLSWNSRDETSISVASHEFGHEWLYFNLPSSSGAHPQQGTHMPAAFPFQTDYDSSTMGGSFWLDNADDTYTTLPYRTYFGYSWHELYLMGLATFDEAQDWWFLTGVEELQAPYFPVQSTTFAAGRELVSKEVLEVVDPQYPDAQSDFNILVVLVTRPENPATDFDIANVRRKVEIWPPAWETSVGHRATLTTQFSHIEPTGDFDFDGDVDLLDFGQFQLCYAGDGAVISDACRAFDLDVDGDVDLADFGVFQLSFTGACLEPNVVSQPSYTRACMGETVAIGAVVNHADQFQWYRAGVPVAGQTSATLTIENASPADNGTYILVAANDCSTVHSASATLRVNDPPDVIIYPNQRTFCPGVPISLVSDVEGRQPLTYQWSRDGADISGADQPTLTLDNPTAADAGRYHVTVTDACGQQSFGNELVLTLDPACLP